MQEADLTELLPTLRELNRADKLRAVQYLVSEIAREEGATPGASEVHPVWSPYESYEAAGALLAAMQQAMNDEMFLTDLRETMDDFAGAAG